RSMWYDPCRMNTRLTEGMSPPGFLFLDTAPPVVRLLFWSRPPAIPGLIVALVVDAVKTGSGRPLTHVGEEALEAVQPAVADRNAATAVQFIIGGRFVGAPV